MKKTMRHRLARGLFVGGACLPFAFAHAGDPDTTTWNGTVPESGATITAGEHVFANGLTIGTTSESQPLRISGGKVTVNTGNVLIAKNGGGEIHGELVIDGTGVFEAKDSTIWLPNDEEGIGRMTVRGSGSATVKQISSLFNKRTGYLDLSEQGSLTITGDNSVLGDNDTDYFSLTMADSARLTTGKVKFGSSNAARYDVSLDGGTVSVPNKEWVLGGGYGSTFVFNGAAAAIKWLTIEGQERADYTNTVEVAAGSVTVESLTVRTKPNRNTMVLVSGGELNVTPNQPAIGDQGGNNVETDAGAIFRQTGGTVNVFNETKLAYSNGAVGRMELLGGVYRGRDIRGWGGSPYRGGTGRVTVIADGGTLAPCSYNNYRNTLLRELPEVRLGAKGLTVDTEGHEATVRVQFVDDGEGVDGRFVKAGAGLLTVYLTETTGTDVIAEARGRSLNSSHAVTVVKGGTMLFADQPTSDGTCRFGRAVSVIDGATLSLAGSATKLAVDALTIGNGQGESYSTIKLDAGDVIEVKDSITADYGAVDISGLSGNGEYLVFTCHGAVTRAQLKKIVLLSAPANKDWAWKTVTDEETGVTSCLIEVADEGTLVRTSAVSYSDGIGTWTGDPEDPVASVSGNGTADADLVLSDRTSIAVSQGETLTLSGKLTGENTIVTKTGAGELVLSGDNAGLTGGFVANGGILTFADKSALGAVERLAKTLTLKADTLRLKEGDTEGVEPLVLKIETAANKTPAIVDVDAGAKLAVTGVEHVQGALIKKGAGELALNLGRATTYTLLKNNGNEDNGNAVVLPDGGVAPTDTSTLSAFTVLEGTVSVTGAGKEQTTLQIADPMLIGANYHGTAPAELRLEDVTLSSGGKHVTFGHKNPAGAFGSRLSMKNARFNTNKLEVGRDGAGDAQDFVITLNDSVLYEDYKMQLGWDKAAVLIAATNSTIECSGDQGLAIAGIVGATFSGPSAALASTKANGTGNGNAGIVSVYNLSRCTGEVRFEDGARLVTTRGLVVKKANNGSVPFIFDNGIYEVRASSAENDCRSKMAQPANQGFVVEKGGLTVDVASDVRHFITFPIRGVGSVVKAGAGTLYLNTATDDANNPSSEKLVQYTGRTTVAAGTLVVDGALVGETASLKADVAARATLDLNGSAVTLAELSGAGTVAHGTLTVAKLVYGESMPTFAEDVTFATGQTVVVDFGCTESSPLDKQAAAAGMVIGHLAGSAPEGVNFVCANTGIKNAKMTVTYASNGDIIGTVKPVGLVVVIR